MKKRQVQAGYWLRMAVITAWMALAAGCSHMQEPEVLGKLETEGEDSQELSEAFDGFPGMPGVPERYEAELQEEGLMLTADAQVELPDAISPGNHRLVSESFTEEEFERIGRSLSGRLGMDWQRKVEQDAQEPNPEEKRQLRVFRIEDGGKCYQVDYTSYLETVRDERGQAAPSLIWWVNQDAGKWKGSSSDSRTYGKSDPAMVGKVPLASELEEDAMSLLEAWGMGDYKVWDAWWMKTSYANRPDEYRYQIRCTPVFEGIPFGGKHGIMEGGVGRLSLPYVRFDYQEDKTLDVVCLVGKCKVSPGKNRDMFFLPFQAVGELFEQYVRDYVRLMPKEGTAMVHVTRVTMEYAGTNIGNSGTGFQKEPETDWLVPVWTFYGYMEEGDGLKPGKGLSPDRTNSYREMPLLSVRADDGQLLFAGYQ